jgi:hypothetical protein
MLVLIYSIFIRKIIIISTTVNVSFSILFFHLYMNNQVFLFGSDKVSVHLPLLGVDQKILFFM